MKLSMKLLVLLTSLTNLPTLGSKIFFSTPNHSTSGLDAVDKFKEKDEDLTTLKKWVYLSIYKDSSPFFTIMTPTSKAGKKLDDFIKEVDAKFELKKADEQFKKVTERYSEIQQEFKKFSDIFLKNYPEEKTSFNKYKELKESFDDPKKPLGMWAEYALDGTKQKPDFLQFFLSEYDKKAYEKLDQDKLKTIIIEALFDFLATPENIVTQAKKYSSQKNAQPYLVTLLTLIDVFKELTNPSETGVEKIVQERDIVANALESQKDEPIAKATLEKLARFTNFSNEFDFEKNMSLINTYTADREANENFKSDLIEYLTNWAKYILGASLKAPSFDTLLSEKTTAGETYKGILEMLKKKPEPEEPKKVEPKEAEDLTTELQNLTNALAELENATKKV